MQASEDYRYVIYEKKRYMQVYPRRPAPVP